MLVESTGVNCIVHMFTQGPPCQPNPISTGLAAPMPRRGVGGRAPRTPYANHHDAGTSTAAEAATDTTTLNPPTPSHRRGKPQSRRPKQHHRPSFGSPHEGTYRAPRAGNAAWAGVRQAQPGLPHTPPPDIFSHGRIPRAQTSRLGWRPSGLHNAEPTKSEQDEEATGKSGRTRPGNGGRSRS